MQFNECIYVSLNAFCMPTNGVLVFWDLIEPSHSSCRGKGYHTLFEPIETSVASTGGYWFCRIQTVANTLHAHCLHSLGQLTLLLSVGEDNSSIAGDMQLDYTPGIRILYTAIWKSIKTSFDCNVFNGRRNVIWIHRLYFTAILMRPCNAWHSLYKYWSSFVNYSIIIRIVWPHFSPNPRSGHRFYGLFIQIQFSSALMHF